MGLQKYGKGDWRSISRNAVVTRTPTQVASHAQKYFLRLKSLNKERKRSSIHDITTVENDSMTQIHLGELDPKKRLEMLSTGKLRTSHGQDRSYAYEQF